jgi:PAS domain S-box-containing protein
VTRKQTPTTGSATVRLVSDQLIECTLSGAVTRDVVKESMRQTEELANLVRTRGVKPRLVIGMEELTSQDSGARSEAKKLVTFGLERIAVYGAGRALTTIGQYIARIAGMGGYTRFFRSRSSAVTWVTQPARKSTNNNMLLVVLGAIIVALSGVATLVGWLVDSDILVAMLPDFKAMNPVTALNMLILATALLLLVTRGKKKWKKNVVIIVALWLFTYGAVVSAGHVFGVSFGIDKWLFTDKLGTLGASVAYSSLGSGLLFVLVGELLLLALTDLRERWRAYFFNVHLFVAVVIIVVALVGYSFGLVWSLGLLAMPVPLNTIVGMAVALLTIVGIIYRPGMFKTVRRLSRLYWGGVAVFIVIAFITSLAWRQSEASIEQNDSLLAQQTFEKTTNAVEGRINTYMDVLRGYKAFFESSGTVEASEFATYYNRSKLEENYPGFNAISFIRYVRPGEKQQFEAQMRAQNTPSLRNFTAQTTPGEDSYILTYSMSRNPNTNAGTNIGILPGRKVTFERARDMGEPLASDVVTFTSANGTSEEGFLITIPIYQSQVAEPLTQEERRNQSFGFVNAVFRSQVIFKEIFESLDIEKGVSFRIATTEQNKRLYEFDTLSSDTTVVTSRFARTITVAGQQWDITMGTESGYASSPFTRTIPNLILGGGLLFALLSALLVISVSRRREQALSLASDMTEDLNNERQLAETMRRKDEAILESIGDAVFAIDKNERITLFNVAAASISGYTQSEALGRKYDEVLQFVNEKTDRIDNMFIHRALGGHAASMKANTMLRRKDGSMVAVADSAAPIRDSSGKLMGVIVVFRDVSKERQLDKAKSEFVSLASHQLRTPLSAINWYSEMLLAGDAGKLNDDQLEYLKEIYQGNQRMIELVDSLLNVSRLEVGKIRNEPKDTSMIELADSLEKELQTMIVSKKMAFERHVPSRLADVYADPKLLRMIVQNLLSNAVKYTPEKGTVTLTMRPAKAEEIKEAKLHSHHLYLFISVSDTGYGIPKDQQGKIFEKLFRADNVRKLDVEGTGLGLYIIKEVSHKLGGTIWFESIEGKGTTFYVIIPFKTKPS